MLLQMMKAVDPRTVDKSTLTERRTIRIDEKASPYERKRQYMRQVKNPYCYLDGKTIVKISFANTDRTIEDCFRNYLCGI